MTRAVTASTQDTLHTVSRLDQMGTLDPLFRDLYLQRARELLAPVLSQARYEDLKTKSGELTWTEQQLRVAVERAEWERACQLSERLRELRTRISSAGQSMKLGEILYERVPISIDPFATELAAFNGSSSESLNRSLSEALQLLESLKRSDPGKANFYNQRRADFNALAIASATTLPEKPVREPAQPKHAALGALDAGDLSRLDEVLNSLVKQTKIGSRSPAVDLSDASGLGDDLLFEFTPETLTAARELGLNSVRTRSRRHLAHLLPHGWQRPSQKEIVKNWSCEQLSRLTFPTAPADRMRDAIEYFLLNPFITSAGTRYKVCLVAEDLLVEDFAEPDVRDESSSKLLSKLGLRARWGLSRLEIEDALLENGLRIIEELQLDPEAFRLGLIPPDIFTHLAARCGWGQQEIWTHFDGYRVLEGGNLQALAGGDKRFGGTHDVVSFGRRYASPRLLARFAVVQRRRMMDWHQRQ
jgi:hypothetical protein